MQPYFFPYIGYWQLVNAVDKFVIYDDVNFVRRGWMTRNKILNNGISSYFNLYTSKADFFAHNFDAQQLSQILADSIKMKPNGFNNRWAQKMTLK